MRERQDPPWGPLKARPIPLLDESEAGPAAPLGVWSAEPIREETWHSLQVTTRAGRGLATAGFVAVQTYLYSPDPRTVTLAAWWGTYFLNGEPVRPRDASVGQMRQELTASLNAGWNRLVYASPLHWDFFDFTLGVPGGIELAASPDLTCTDAFLVGGPWEDEVAADARGIEWSSMRLEHLPESLGPAVAWPKGRASPFPMKQHGWRVFRRSHDRESSSAAAVSFLYEFPEEVLGRPLVEYRAAPGTTVDLFYAERLLPDGMADVHREPWGLYMADRFVTDARETPILTFHPRGFKYLEVFATGDVAGFEVKRVSATRAMYPVSDIGQFRCSDPLLEKIWEIGRNAQRACMEDAYLDCPWRERGLYAGDMLVQFHVNLAAFGDTKLVRRSLELFLQSQTRESGGMIAGGAFGLPAGRHPDYSAITVLALRDYGAITGDFATIDRLRPHWEGLVEGLARLNTAEPPLLGGAELHPYIDCCHLDRGGVNVSLNCFYYGAFAAAAEMMDWCGQPEHAEAWRAKAETLGSAIRERFWSAEGGHFRDRTEPAAGPSVPANTLPLYFDIASPHQASGTLAWLETAMRNNRRVPNPAAVEDLNVNAYFAYYSLAVLYRHGRAAAAEAFIRENWGPMVEGGAWTTWEYFVDSSSHCHAWAAAPTHYLSTEVLGLRRSVPGDPNRFSIRPLPGNLTWASGDYPHPLGPIHVEWRLVDGKPHIQYMAPPGVHVELGGHETR